MMSVIRLTSEKVGTDLLAPDLYGSVRGNQCFGWKVLAFSLCIFCWRRFMHGQWST